jgi:hypothetical protein
MAVLESKLIIGASDETGAAFASVMARINEMSAKLAAVNKGFTPPPSFTGPSRATVAATTAAAPVAAAIPRSVLIPPVAPPPPSASFLETALGAIATFTGIKAVVGGFHEAMEQQHERMRQDLAAMSADEIAKGEKLSADLAAKYPSVPQSEIMHSLRTARTVTGSFDEATDVLEPLTKLRVIAQAASPGTSAEDMRAEFDKLVKALEVAGVATDKPKLNSYINDVAKSLNAFGDQIKPEDYFDMLRYGRQASSRISERFLMTTLATLGSEFGGSNVGTALSGFNQAVVGNRFTHTAALGFAQLGLIDDKDLARTKTGEIKGILPGRHVKDVQLAQSDPDLWIKQDYLPALTKAGITTPDAISARIAQDFTNRNAANLVTQIALQQNKLEKNTALWNQASGLTGADVLNSKDASTAFAGVGNAIERWIAKRFDVDSYGQVGSAVSRAVGAVTPSPGPHPDLGADAAADLKGWRDLFSSIRIGGPQTSEQWHADMRANSSLWGAGYRPGDLEQETAREHSRAVSRTPLSFRGQSDWETHAPASVTVNGQAQVDHEITVRIEASPLLQAIVDQARQQSETTVPLWGGGTGRMDSDAAAHRVGGIGSM